MATITQKKRNIRYLNRDFDSYKKSLIDLFKIYFSNANQDFNESSVGMMLNELVSYMGDNLSFYLDRRFEESFMETARERANVFKHSRYLGFKSFGKTAAAGKVDAFLKVPARRVNEKIVPDTRYAGKIRKGAKLKSDSGQTYETVEDIDFSKVNINDTSLVRVGDSDSTTGQPLNFILKQIDVDVIAGETKSTTFTVGGYQPFMKLILPDDDVSEVTDSRDSDGNVWYEVDYLAQDTVFDSLANGDADSTDVPFLMRLRTVPFRFVTQFDTVANRMAMIFGTGDAQSFDGDLIPDIGDLSLPAFGKTTFTEFTLDPQNFLKTRTLGLAPVNTNMTVHYRVGGGEDTNAAQGEIKTVAESVFEIGDSTLATATVNDVGNSFSVFNPNPIQGGLDELSIDAIKQLATANFAAQSRVVTAPDFVARALSMPSKFGSVFRASSKVNALNKNAVELVVLSKNASGNVVAAPNSLKTNIKNYFSRFRMLTDAIEILDGETINIAVEFRIMARPGTNRNEIVIQCISALRDYFTIDNWQINQPINLTDLHCLLADIPGVLSVIEINIFNRVGNHDNRSYSSTVHHMDEFTQNGIIYGKENAIFEVKFPNVDIFGSSK